MKKALIIITTMLATLTASAQYATPQAQTPPDKTLLIFKTQRQAKTWTTIAGFTGIAAGAYLGGKAEMHRMYHGTTENWDTYHITRDASIVVTGLGSASLGASVVIGDKICPWEILYKAVAAPLLYRIVAQGTYNATKPK